MTTKSATGGKKRKLVNVHLLDGSQCIVYVDVKSKFQEVFNQVTGHLCLRETEYFGLAFKKENEYQFVVLDEKVHKHAPKHWKSGPGEGVDSQGRAIINVWFRVQFYVDQVVLLREKVTRHQYYLQLKDNVLQYNHVYSEEKCFQQAAYALQADFGNEKHEEAYFSPTLYFPHWILERHGVDYLAHNVPILHRDLHNMTRNDAELRYIRNASTPPGALNLHFYMVRKHKTDKHCNTWLAICARGVEVYEDDAGYKNHISTFMWRDIGKLYFDKKKFEVRSVQSAGGRRYIYYTDCDIKSKYLLSICRSTHMFQMAIQPKLMEIQHLDNEDQKRYRESYVSSEPYRESNVSNEPRDRSQLCHSPSTSTNASVSSHNNQRLSVVSDASSNTTSGIVSDRMAVSFDDGDDHSREMMIDCSAQLPRRIRSKLQLFSSFNQSPHYSSQASPNLSLELCRMEGMTGSTEELAHTVGCGSWQACHSHTSGCLLGAAGLALPSSVTHSQDSKSCCLQAGRGAGHKDGFCQMYHGRLLQTVDRNTSGDSAVSMSGPNKSLLQTHEQYVASADEVVLSISQTPPLSQPTNLVHGPSPSPLLNFISSASKVSSPQRVFTPHKTVNSTPDVTEKLSAPQTDIPLEHGRLWVPITSQLGHCQPSISPHELSTASRQLGHCQPSSSPHELSTASRQLGHCQPSSSPHELSTASRQLGHCQPSSSPHELSTASRQLGHCQPSSSPHELSTASQSSEPYKDLAREQLRLATPSQDRTQMTNKVETASLSHDDDNLPKGKGGLADLTNRPIQNQQPLVDGSLNQHIVEAQVHQRAEPQLAQRLQQSPQTVTEPQLAQRLQQAPQTVTEPQLAQRLQQAPQTVTEPQLAHILQQAPKTVTEPQVAHILQQSPQTVTEPQLAQRLQAPQTVTEPQVAHILQQAPQTITEPQLAHILQQAPQTVTEHYLLALQQGSDQRLEKRISEPVPDVDQQEQPGFQLQQPPQLLQQPELLQQLQLQQPQLQQQLHLQQPQLQQQLHLQQPQLQQQPQLLQQPQLQQQRHLQHQRPELQLLQSDNLQSHPHVQSADYVQETEDNKENLNMRDKNEEDRKMEAQSRSKVCLHPELKQILGQSHAFSLPLMTALCNDSTLMQASRSQSGSRSSYETSTMRSTDSRLTRLSHDTDSRRWSSCCQSANMPDVTLMSSRPYSWHSEHFDLDSQLALPSADHLPPVSPPNPRSVNNKHLSMNSHQNIVAQKMIVSDPGPASPRLLTMGEGTCWWEVPASATEIDDTLSSWTGIIPYSLPSHHHQQMVPHKLSSGGHMDSDSSLAHKQVMKESIGIA